MLFINPDIDKITQSRIVKKFTYACFPASVVFLASYLRQRNNAEVRGPVSKVCLLVISCCVFYMVFKKIIGLSVKVAVISLTNQDKQQRINYIKG